MTEDQRNAESSAPGYRHTIDWDRYWDGRGQEARTDLDANPSAEYVRDPLLEFLDERIVPESYADVGCGTGTVAFAVADRYPDADVVGYDAAEPVLAANRERARERDVANVRFERVVLPSFGPGQEFDVVSTFFTLCYVTDTADALRNLYDAVSTGGSLVFTYHNRFATAFYERAAEAPEDYLDDSFPSDSERFRRRFRAVLDGESLLSYERIHEALGTWPQSLWSVVGREHRYGAWRSIPLVYVPKTG